MWLSRDSFTIYNLNIWQDSLVFDINTYINLQKGDPFFSMDTEILSLKCCLGKKLFTNLLKLTSLCFSLFRNLSLVHHHQWKNTPKACVYKLQASKKFDLNQFRQIYKHFLELIIRTLICLFALFSAFWCSIIFILTQIDY